MLLETTYQWTITICCCSCNIFSKYASWEIHTHLALGRCYFPNNAHIPLVIQSTVLALNISEIFITTVNVEKLLWNHSNSFRVGMSIFNNFHNRSSFKLTINLIVNLNYCKMRLLQWHIVTGMTGCANATQNASFLTRMKRVFSLNKRLVAGW